MKKYGKAVDDHVWVAFHKVTGVNHLGWQETWCDAGQITRKLFIKPVQVLKSTIRAGELEVCPECLVRLAVDGLGVTLASQIITQDEDREFPTTAEEIMDG